MRTATRRHQRFRRQHQHRKVTGFIWFLGKIQNPVEFLTCSVTSVPVEAVLELFWKIDAS
jgi:hypothetical protein